MTLAQTFNTVLDTFISNRLTSAKGSAVTTFTYDAADQLTSSLLGSNSTTYNYDGTGKLHMARHWNHLLAQ